MNIPTYLIGAVIFLIGQTTGAIWWASSLSAEVQRLSGIQGTAIPVLQAAQQACEVEIHNLKKLTGDQKEIEESVKNLDVMLYRLQTIETMLDKILATKVR
tara:strand:+ start:178 stop:480 length:303 start_codon:yes stop_codon:yes gene_type:complete